MAAKKDTTIYWVIAGIAISAILWVSRKPIIRGVLDANQEYYIGDLHPKAKESFRDFIRAVEKRGYQVIVTSGYRSFSEQAKLKAQNSKNASPGNSYHNYGMALDINLVKDNSWWRKSTPKDEWEKTGIPQLARRLGMKWGGDFTSYHDPVHFTVPVKPVNELLVTAKNQFGTNVNNIQGNKVQLV